MMRYPEGGSQYLKISQILREREEEDGIILLKSPRQLGWLIVAPTARLLFPEQEESGRVLDEYMDDLLADTVAVSRARSEGSRLDKERGLLYPRAEYLSPEGIFTVSLYPDYQLAENMHNWEIRVKEGLPVNMDLEDLTKGLRSQRLEELKKDPALFNQKLQREVLSIRISKSNSGIPFPGFLPLGGSSRHTIPGVRGLI